MKIALIDVDSHNYPNLALMKLSAYHKAKGDSVEWYDIFTGHCDVVYKSKVFSFTDDYNYYIDADKIISGGTGYCIEQSDKEVFHADKHVNLNDDIEHIYPDYSIYQNRLPDWNNTAFGFLTRGCPRACPFCIVGKKESLKSYKVADLAEFWKGQKRIEILDPNLLASADCYGLLEQLQSSKAKVNFNQGLDIRLMTEQKANLIEKIKLEQIHFAWDNYKDKELILPKFKLFRGISSINERNTTVYVLCNFNSTFEQDLERIYTLRDMGFTPYVMLYQKYNIPTGDKYRDLQRYVNNRFIFRSCKKFENYRKWRS